MKTINGINGLKMSMNFNLRAVKKCETQVYCVVRIDTQQFKISVAKIPTSAWDKRQQCCMYNATLNTDALHAIHNVNIRINEMRRRWNDIILYLCGNKTTNIKEYVINSLTYTNMANPNPNKVIRSATATKLLNDAFEKMYPNNDRSKQQNRSTLNSFFAFIHDTKKGDSTHRLTQKGLREYKEWLIAAKNSADTINIKCRLIKRLVSFIIENTDNQYNLTPLTYTRIENKIKKDDRLHRAFTDDEINAILNITDIDDQLREAQNLFKMQLLTGVRASDLPKLFTGDYEISTKKDGTFYTLMTQKRQITAVVIVNSSIQQLQQRYKVGFVHHDLYKIKSFEQKYNRAIKKIAEKAGLTAVITYSQNEGGKVVEREKRLCDAITSHWARHTFITQKLREGYTEEEVIRLTGHAGTDTVHRIYSHLNATDKIDLVSRAQERLRKEAATTHTHVPTAPAQNDEVAYLRRQLAEKTTELALHQAYSKMTAQFAIDAAKINTPEQRAIDQATTDDAKDAAMATALGITLDEYKRKQAVLDDIDTMREE